MKEIFECCFELPHEGIFLEVANVNSHIEISFYSDNKVQGSVCFRDDENLDRLINVLQLYREKLRERN